VGYLSPAPTGGGYSRAVDRGSRTALALASPCRDEDAAAVQSFLVEIGHRVVDRIERIRARVEPPRLSLFWTAITRGGTPACSDPGLVTGDRPPAGTAGGRPAIPVRVRVCERRGERKVSGESSRAGLELYPRRVSRRYGASRGSKRGDVVTAGRGALGAGIPELNAPARRAPCSTVRGRLS
jgi:hypothetical protein